MSKYNTSEISSSSSDSDEEKPEKLLKSLDLNGVTSFIKSDKCKNILVMCGAGLSTAAGIPDFRSPRTGLYDNLQKYNLPRPEAVFELEYFKKNPKPFYTLAKELYPGKYKPTLSHFFLRLLEKKKLLQRVYTQNIDTLERRAGVSGKMLVEAHGTFHTSKCIKCKKVYSENWVKDKIFKNETPVCTKCGKDAYVKPDIVFFGEQLPPRFFKLHESDFKKCDLLFVIGTSLNVQPFSLLTGNVEATTPRVLINREKCNYSKKFWYYGSSRFDFDSEKAYRDVALLGNCDQVISKLCEKLGWKKELDELIADADKIDNLTASFSLLSSSESSGVSTAKSSSTTDTEKSGSSDTTTSTSSQRKHSTTSSESNKNDTSSSEHSSKSSGSSSSSTNSNSSQSL